MKENVYGTLAADIDDSTPETDALLAQYRIDGEGRDHDPPFAELARRLERERNEARWHADADVMSSIESGSTEPDKKGWRRDCEANEYELRYAAKRGLIERHPVHPTRLRIIEEPSPTLAADPPPAQWPSQETKA